MQRTTKIPIGSPHCMRTHDYGGSMVALDGRQSNTRDLCVTISKVLIGIHNLCFYNSHVLHIGGLGQAG